MEQSGNGQSADIELALLAWRDRNPCLRGETWGTHFAVFRTDVGHPPECVTAIELEATVEEMMFTIHAHPTLSESLLDGFSSVEGLAVNV